MSYADLLLQNLAAESDIRTMAQDWRWWTRLDGDYAVIDDVYNEALWEAGVTPRLEDENETIFTVRISMAVCPLCDGRGKHVNPSIDAHGLTREDFDEDPDFAESYFRGDYDQRCNLCHGEKVVPVPLDPVVAQALLKHERDIAETRAEQLAEMRMGA